ncbi:hypothetical protein PENTCL1PPCAC_19002 [Pristionchus entomophagus]|uniref:Bicd-1 n=1 Tax=Pristionchus entomophagus TaxID=358040 RepID=A0AAV5TRL3_9BILA|nr:hypothetical protein PENTCL1PPCAC_19002 [Pristionchus entomophagus]
MTEGGPEELVSLRAEKERLEKALDDAYDANEKAALAGMDLLKKQQELERANQQLNEDLQNAHAEAEAARHALEDFQSKHKKFSKNERENEQNLLDENEDKEDEYRNRIAVLEADLRSKEQEVERVHSELADMQQQLQQTLAALKELEDERNKLKADQKDMKEREQRNAADLEFLEEENILHQKTIANLRGAQVEMESYKVEINQLAEQLHQSKNTLEESESLRRIMEIQHEEALILVQQERDQRLQLKREYDALKNQEHLNSLSSILGSIGSGEPIQVDGPPMGGGGSLFDELNSDNRIQDLETQKERLEEEVREREKASVDIISSLINKLSLDNKGEVNYKQWRQHRDIILDKVESLAKGGDPEAEKKLHKAHADLRAMLLLAGERTAQMASAQDLMISVGDGLYQLYHHMNQTQQRGADKSILQVVQTLRQLARDNAEQTQALTADDGESGTETESGRSAPIALNANRIVLSKSFMNEATSRLGGTSIESIVNDGDERQRISTDGTSMVKSAEGATKLLHALRRSIEQMSATSAAAVDADDLTAQNNKLRNLLSVKREQISSLRTVLKSNKETAENALISLRDKYENEKSMYVEINEKLRKELKSFKEDAATFASHRAMFTARCEELQAKVEELQAERQANEEEKKTLNQLLRLAIQQKLNLTQRLEEVEVDRTERAAPRRVAQRPPNQNNMRGHPDMPRVRYPPRGGGGGGGPIGPPRRDFNQQQQPQ